MLRVLFVENMRVYIADDSDGFRTRLTAMLSKVDGVNIIGQAGNVREALDGITALRPDVVILDIKMPGGSGIEVLQHIKNEFPETVVIILTNYPYPEYREKCLHEGADHFFVKSLEFTKVIDTLRIMF